MLQDDKIIESLSGIFIFPCMVSPRKSRDAPLLQTKDLTIAKHDFFSYLFSRGWGLAPHREEHTQIQENINLIIMTMSECEHLFKVLQEQ